ncbi:sensor histidine kinase [Rhodocytophaga rosea]|uniref:histidine kinase n=1 Tax=Rhodocytophaga rosea TaxID=2704465 RepID=A0A6C0GP00_9BACT|nr:tetratricopeptide repeat protein [Rhodocytophaga rosea]QHT69756.1 sensor histidine kinase [Rhodocytophaga rosea]
MKYLAFLFSLVICVYGSTFGQTPAIDSLDRLILKVTTDTARIKLLLKKADFLVEVNLDSAINVSKRTIQAAEKINYKKGEANARLGLATGYNFKGEYKAASLNLKIAEEIFLSLQDSTGLGTLYGNYGMMYGMQSKYDSSIYYYERAIQVAEGLHDDRLLNNAYKNIAISYYMQSNFTPAMLYMQKSLVYYEKQKNIRSQANTLMNMGLIYDEMGDKVRAEESLMKSITLSKAAGVRNVELYAYSNLASLYESKKNYQLSYEYAMKAAVLGREMGDNGIEAASLSKAVISLAKLNKLGEAEKLARQAILTADLAKQPMNSYQAYAAMGLVLKLQNKFDRSIEAYSKAFEVMQESDIYDESIGETYFNLSESYSKVGDYQKALTAYQKYAEIADSVRSQENIRKATEINMNYEFEKKQQLAAAEQERKNVETRNRQLVLSVGLGLTILVALIAFYAFRTKLKANTLLQRQKEEIETAMTELRTTQAQLIQKEKMASLGELTAGIAHEIQNPLNFVNNFAEVSNELLEELQQELMTTQNDETLVLTSSIKTNLSKIVHHGKRADAIVKSMLQHSSMSSGEKQLLDMNVLIDEYLRLAYHGLKAKEKDFNADLITDLDVSIDRIKVVPQEIGRVLLNLFNNAFYATQQKKQQLNGQYQPQVTVTTKAVRNKVEIRVKDNGTGIPEAVKDKIFQPFFTTKPTGEGTGLGLSLSYDIITKGHGGELKVESKEDEFTEMIICLPAV